MRCHPYEYKVLVEYINPAEKGIAPHLTHESDQEAFTRIMNDVFEHLPDSIPQGWEVNSHSITTSRDTVMVTILLRRQFRNPEKAIRQPGYRGEVGYGDS